jgi:hypothetical protein
MQRQKRINGMNEERENTPPPLKKKEESPGRSARHHSHLPIWCYRLIMKYLVNDRHDIFFFFRRSFQKNLKI